MKVVITSGTGFIGQSLQKMFTSEGSEVLIISRGNKHINWNDEKGMLNALEGTDVLINLAGKSVDCRYTNKNKALILSSRIETTLKLQQMVESLAHPPKLWINSSTATIYRHAEDRPMDECTGDIGSGFFVEIAKAWEAAFFERVLPATRKVALCIAITIGKNGGVMRPFINLVKYGLGGKQGNGKQMFSWIHVEDLYKIIRHVIDHDNMKGIYNCSAPHPVTNAEFMKEMRKILNPFIYLPSPELMLKLGTYFINTETELILKSRWVLPKKLQESGFTFRFPTIDKALENILASIKQGV